MDDCFIIKNSVNTLLQIKEHFQQYSVLNLTHRPNSVVVVNSIHLHIKNATSTGINLNATSECSGRYKEGNERALIHRIYKISSTWHIFYQSIQTLRQSLTNNGNTNLLLDSMNKEYINNLHNSVKKY